MRSIIHNHVSHTFVEGPIQAMLADSSLTEMKTEKAIYHADLNQGYEAKGDSNDIDIPYYETNERYD